AVEAPRPAAFDGGSGPLSEIDRALAVIGAAHWIENVRTAAHPGDRAPRHLDQSAALEHQHQFPQFGLSARCRSIPPSVRRAAYDTSRAAIEARQHGF